jgi:RNase P protein component
MMKTVFPFVLGLVLLLGAGCASVPQTGSSARVFSFPEDTFAYANELRWEYAYDEDGNWTHRPRDQRPEYAQHCFVMARSAKQFFLHARFDPGQPAVSRDTYRRLVRQVVRASPRRLTPPEKRVVLPGYESLRAFSGDHEDMLKAECGGAWQSYLQRGNWRMVFPFSRSHQEKTALRLAGELEGGHVAVVHLARFPRLTINHAVVLFAVERSGTEIRFAVYDPNNVDEATELAYDSCDRTFYFPANTYFFGGRVDVYEVYRSLLY